MDYDIKINGTGRRWKEGNWIQMAQNKVNGRGTLRRALNLRGP